MVKRLLFLTLACAVALTAAPNKKAAPAPEAEKASGSQEDDVKADSMVYDQPTEWRVYSINGPAKAFALQGDQLWQATDAEVGLITMRGKRSETQRLKTLGAMPAEGIVAIAADRQGGIWFGGPNGVALKSGTQFKVFTAPAAISDNNVTCIAVGNDGTVWVGTENGLNAWSGGAWKKYSTKDGLVSNKIQALLTDKKGTLWVGTNKGISIWNGAKWTSQTMKNGMSWNDTKALGYDARTGLLWAAVGEKDVNSFDGQKWNVYMEILEGISSIMADTHSRIWFGSGTAGLVKYNDEEWVSDPAKLGVPGSQIFQIHCDEKGNHWFANEKGVVRMENPYPH
jgi:ligand-binding sensor domain-containing protein